MEALFGAIGVLETAERDESDRILLDQIVQPGQHSLELYAARATEIETGDMRRNAARYWLEDGREELLGAGLQMDDILEDWDEDAYGPPPEEDSEGWLDHELSGECNYVHMNPVLRLPEDGFFSGPLPAPAAARGTHLALEDTHPHGERSSMARWTIELAQLCGKSGLVHFRPSTEAELYGVLAPSTWKVTNEWGHNLGTQTITVTEAVTLRELLRDQPLHAELWVDEQGGHHFREIAFGHDR